jgi:hypothetical protein
MKKQSLQDKQEKKEWNANIRECKKLIRQIKKLQAKMVK